MKRVQVNDGGRRRGFTLIELLVVVSIIALLLMLLSPTIQSITQQVQVVNCLRNLKQIHQTAMQYCDDNNGWLVRLRDYFHSSQGAQQAIHKKTFFSHNLSRTYLENNYAIFSCPTVHDRNLELAEDHEAVMDYGINHYGRGCHRRGGCTAEAHQNDNGPYWHSMGQHNSPIRREWVADATAIYFADADYAYSPHDIAGVSRGTMEWPFKHSFSVEAWDRHMGPGDPSANDFQTREGYSGSAMDATITAFDEDHPLLDDVKGGYNAVSLDGWGTWRPGIERGNEHWFIPKHVADE